MCIRDSPLWSVASAERRCNRRKSHPTQKEAIDPAHRLRLPLDHLQRAGCARSSVRPYVLFPLRAKSGGRRAAEPAAVPREQTHIVPYPLRDRLPLQLGEDARNIHHRLAHRLRGVELLSDAEKRDPEPQQLLDCLLYTSRCV